MCVCVGACIIKFVRTNLSFGLFSESLFERQDSVENEFELRASPRVCDAYVKDKKCVCVEDFST